jgi:hypothetical protein
MVQDLPNAVDIQIVKKLPLQKPAITTLSHTR